MSASGSHTSVIEQLLNADLRNVSSWLIAKKLTLNVLKTVYMIVGSRQRMATMEGDLNLKVNEVYLNRVKYAKCLEVQIDENLTWEKHTEYIIKKVVCSLSILRKVSSVLTLNNKIN